MAEVFALLLNTKGRPVPVEAVQAVLNEAKDWARFDLKIWLVATEQTSKYWFDRIRAVLNPQDDVMLVKVDLSDKQGWVSQVVIDWLFRDHNARPGR